MTRAGITVTGREVTAISAIGAILTMGFWLGINVSQLRAEIQGMRRDICHYAIPDEARRFANSCQEFPLSGLAAQSTP